MQASPAALNKNKYQLNQKKTNAPTNQKLKTAYFLISYKPNEFSKWKENEQKSTSFICIFGLLKIHLEIFLWFVYCAYRT